MSKSKIPEAPHDSNGEPDWWLYYSWPLEDAGLDMVSHRVLCRIWAQAKVPSGQCWESVKSMAAAMQMGERTVQMALRYLIECGFIKVVGSRLGGPCNATVRYQPLPPGRWSVGVKRSPGKRRVHGLHPLRRGLHPRGA